MRKLLVLLLLAGIGLTYWPVILELYTSRFELLNYTHGYFILPLALLMMLARRDHLNYYLLRHPITIAFLLTVSCINLYLLHIGLVHDYLIISSLSLVVQIILMLLLLSGRSGLKQFALTCLLLVLLVPPPFGMLDELTLPLRHLASTLSACILQLAGFNVTTAGLLIYLNGTEIYLGEPCSGFRSIMMLLTLSITFAFFKRYSCIRSFILIIATIPLALIANTIRVIIIALLAHYFGTEIASGMYHSLGGLFVFLLATVGLLGVDAICERRQKSASYSSENNFPAISGFNTATLSGALLMICLLAGATIFNALTPEYTYEQTSPITDIQLPDSIPYWTSREANDVLKLTDDRYRFIGQTLIRLYTHISGAEILVMALDANNFHHPRICYSSSGFTVQELNATAVTLDTNQHLELQTLLVTRGQTQQLIFYWLEQEGKQIQWHEQKRNHFINTLLHRKPQGLMIRLDVPIIRNSVEQTTLLTQYFLKDLLRSRYDRKLDE